MKYSYLLLLLFGSVHGASWLRSKTQKCPASKDYKKISCTFNTHKKRLTFKEGNKTTTCTYDAETEFTILKSTGVEESYCKESALVTLLNPDSQNLTIKTITTIEHSDAHSEIFSRLLPTFEYISLLAAAITKEHPDNSLPHIFLKKYYSRSSQRISKKTHDQIIPPKYSPKEDLPDYEE